MLLPETLPVTAVPSVVGLAEASTAPVGDEVTMKVGLDEGSSLSVPLSPLVGSLVMASVSPTDGELVNPTVDVVAVVGLMDETPSARTVGANDCKLVTVVGAKDVSSGKLEGVEDVAGVIVGLKLLNWRFLS